MIVQPREILAATYREVLPSRFNSPAAAVMLIAIGLQESRFTHRWQINGPARGFFQFEPAGIRGVLDHPVTARYASAVCAIRTVERSIGAVYTHLPTDDLLACAFARLLLWSDPLPLPSDADNAWRYYLRTWRPGKPHRSTWDQFFYDAQLLAREE